MATIGVATPAAALPPDAEIHRIIEQRVQAVAGPEGGMGIVVGVLDAQGPRVIAYGDAGGPDRRPLNGDTVFEIASVTKVFTALLLADMVRTGDLALTEPVAKYLPPGTRLPERNGKTITLVDLATHTAGLPFMPPDFGAALQPGATRYTKADLYRAVAGHALTRDIGSGWDYSNLDYWLLQEAIAARSGQDFEQVLRERVIVPLGLRSTAITLSPELKARAAVGHDAAMEPAQPIASMPVFELMPAAGALSSTANDLLKFLRAPGLALLLQTRRPASGGNEQALGWMIEGKGDDAIVLHDGGSFGFTSSLAWQPERRVGVVVLSNQTAGVSDIARHLLRPGQPLVQPARARRTEIKLDTSVLDTYVGRYQMDEGVVVVTREGALLGIALPTDWGLPKLPLYAQSKREFFARALPLQATFEVDANGRVTGMLVHPPRGQRAIPARRL